VQKTVQEWPEKLANPPDPKIQFGEYAFHRDQASSLGARCESFLHDSVCSEEKSFTEPLQRRRFANACHRT
jgi:hypothetical protein